MMKLKRPRPKKRPHQINEEIRVSEVRLIDEDKKQLGIVPISEALAIARSKELDLVSISPNAEPPVCRLLDYGKYLYSLQKKAHEAQKMQRKVHVKEIKFTPVIGEHDIEVKLKKIKEFLEDGDKVKVTIWLRGRQKRRPEMLDEMTNKILKILEEFAEIESPPKNERWSNHILIGKRRGDKTEKGDKNAQT
jgi:translation initiation factor IF-3